MSNGEAEILKLREEVATLTTENSILQETNKEIRNLADDKDNYILSLEDSKRTFKDEMEKMLIEKDVRRHVLYTCTYTCICTCTCTCTWYPHCIGPSFCGLKFL